MAKKVQKTRSLKFEDNIPKRWVLARFDEIADVTDYVANGSFASLKENVTYRDEPNYAVLIRYTDYVKGWNGNYKYVDKHAYNFLSKSALRVGDLVIANVGNPGKLFIVPNIGMPMTLGPNSVLIKPNPLISTKYLAYFFDSAWGKDLINQIITGTAQRKFNKTSLKSINLPIAPVEQQKLVVDKIEELFSHIDASVKGLKKAKAKLQQYRQSVLKDAVKGELTREWRQQNLDKLEPAEKLLERILIERRERWEAQQIEEFKSKEKLPKNDKWKEKYKEPNELVLQDVPNIPDQWCYARLDAITDIQGGLTVDSKRKPENTTTLPYLRVANVQRGYLDLKIMKKIKVPTERVETLLLKDRDILFNEGGDRDKLGRGWVWHNDITPCTYQNHVFRARPYSESIVSEFISIFGNTFGQEYFIKQGKQTTNLASINKTKLSAFPVPLCSRQEMLHIMQLVNEKLTSIDRVSNDVEIQLKKSNQLKQSVLAKAFSEKLVPNNEECESAENLLDFIKNERELAEIERKLNKKKPTKRRVNKMEKRSILEVLKENKKEMSVDELFEHTGRHIPNPESIEEFYLELKEAVSDECVSVREVKLNGKKQGDKFLYEEKV